MKTDLLSYHITVRDSGGTNFALVHGEDFRASCTMSSELAAKRCAEKFCQRRKLNLEKLERYGVAHCWILSASAPLREKSSPASEAAHV